MSKFTINALNYNPTLFVKAVCDVFSNEVKYPKFINTSLNNIIVKFFKIEPNERDIKLFLVDIFNICKGMGEMDLMFQHEIKIALQEKKKKLEQVN